MHHRAASRAVAVPHNSFSFLTHTLTLGPSAHFRHRACIIHVLLGTSRARWHLASCYMSPARNPAGRPSKTPPLGNAKEL